MLEAAGFSRLNPYNIVPQGKVTKLTTMKDEQRLDLVKEIAGTRLYDMRREESRKIMSQTRDRRGKIVEMLGYIETRLAELSNEKEELATYQALDKRRKACDYAYYDKELRKAKAELEKMDSKRAADAEACTSANKREDEVKRAVKAAEKKMNALGADLKLLAAEISTAADDQKKLMEQVARAEVELKQSEDDNESRKLAEETAKRELKDLEQQVKQVKTQLDERAPECAQKVAEAERLAREHARVEAKLHQLYAREGRAKSFSTKKERDAHLKKEIASLKAIVAKNEQQARMLRTELDGMQQKAVEQSKAADAAKAKLAQHRAIQEEARQRIAVLQQDRDAKAGVRKGLWRQEQELLHAMKTNEAELDKARRTLQYSMSRAQWDAVQAVKRIAAQQKIKGVHGMLLELFSVDERFFTAVEVSAGNQLFQVVVDNDEVAARLMKELQKANAGRVTFMPLNRIRPGPDPAYPDSLDGVPMLKKLKFNPEFRPAMAQVFRKCLVVRNLDVGSKFSKSHHLNCVTMEGDQVSDKGAVSGGYLDVRRSRLQAQLDVVKLGEQASDHAKQKERLAEEIAEVDQQVTALVGELQREEAVLQKAAAAMEMEGVEASAHRASTSTRDQHRAADAQKERAHAALLSAAQADRERLEAFEAELASDFTSGSSPEEEQQRKTLQERLQVLSRESVRADKARVQVEGIVRALETQLSEHLQRRQGELEAEIERLHSEGCAQSPERGGSAATRLEELRSRLSGAEKAHADLASQHESKKREERDLAASLEKLRAELAAEISRQQEEAKELDRLLSRRSQLQRKQEEATDCIRKLGAIPSGGFDQSFTSKSREQLMAEKADCNRQLEQLGHVNKKAHDQYVNFSDQRHKLLEREKEIVKGEEAITALIEHLDAKKDEALERTFKGVAKNFADVFKELVPGGEGKMTMRFSEEESDVSTASKRIASYSGIALKVRFASGGDVQTMEQLSGGQKTMVALVLIFAIQRCDPAPFYIFDEIDAALDATFRASLAKMIMRQSMDTDENGEECTPTQFITTTFRPELIRAGTKFYGVTHRNKVSTIKSIDMKEALRIISEDKSRALQHVGSHDA